MGQHKGTEPPAVPRAGNLGQFLPKKGKKVWQGLPGEGWSVLEVTLGDTAATWPQMCSPNPNPAILGLSTPAGFQQVYLEPLLKFHESLRRLRLHEAEYALLQAMLLFSPGEPPQGGHRDTPMSPKPR